MGIVVVKVFGCGPPGVVIRLRRLVELVKWEAGCKSCRVEGRAPSGKMKGVQGINPLGGLGRREVEEFKSAVRLFVRFLRSAVVYG